VEAERPRCGEKTTTAGHHPSILEDEKAGKMLVEVGERQKLFLVTVKFDSRPKVAPGTPKMTGPCPATLEVNCTDVEGKHHTVLASRPLGTTIEEVAASFTDFLHVTRIEEVPGEWERMV
jgi:hypothetical protein